ncbi:MAG: flagellar basal body-associated FliL family protein, partial [Lachnospiraceae bacterium]|nr:flagellar basal body-associated FliL family protein [Lachnospiraceae bacterium]
QYKMQSSISFFILFFVFMPSVAKTNKLIGDISEVLDLELTSQSAASAGQVDVNNLVEFKLEEGSPINLASNGDDELHALKYGITIKMDKTAKDYEKINTTLSTSTSYIYDITRDVVGQYTYEQVIDVNVRREIKEKLLVEFKEYFNTECIYSVEFYDWVAQ